MENIFHEKQEGALCAQHCLNSLLQGAYFNAVDLASIARELDEIERETMAMGNVNSPEYLDFLQQPSSNFDDSGYFSIQVICKALEFWGLQMIPYNSQAAVSIRNNPIAESAYICNHSNHWLTIRKFGKQWFNLNSTKMCPELISDTYLSLFMAQLQQEGYSIFVIKGTLPDSEADKLFIHLTISQSDFKEYENKIRQKSKKKSDNKQDTSFKMPVDDTPAKPVDKEDVRLKRLNYFLNKDSKTEPNDGGGNVDNIKQDPDELSEEEMLKTAIEMSMGNSLEETSSNSSPPQTNTAVEMSEEDMLQLAVQMSMENAST